MGDEHLGYVSNLDSNLYNSVKMELKSVILSANADSFLDEHLINSEITGSTHTFAKEQIIRIIKKHSHHFHIDTTLKKIKNKSININYLIESDSYIETIMDEYKVPLNLVLDIFNIAGKPSSASIGKGEFMLAVFTNLSCSKTKDLKNEIGLIYEVKDNGISNSGFRVGSQGKTVTEAIKKLNEIKIDNFDENKSFNTTEKGNGISLIQVLDTVNKNNTAIDLQSFSKVFLTFEDTYNSTIDIVTSYVIEKNCINEFKSYLGLLQIYGYMIAEDIDYLLCFSKAGLELGIMSLNKDFAIFYNNYKENISISGWENDGRSMSFKIKYIKT